jgi:hypothetical protein
MHTHTATMTLGSLSIMMWYTHGTHLLFASYHQLKGAYCCASLGLIHLLCGVQAL